VVDLVWIPSFAVPISVIRLTNSNVFIKGICTGFLVPSKSAQNPLAHRFQILKPTSKVAIDRTKPRGRVLGVDIIPAQPPKGMSTIQGNFLSPAVQSYVQEFLRDPARGRPRNPSIFRTENDQENCLTEEELEERQRGYIDREKSASMPVGELANGALSVENRSDDETKNWTVDVVLSDMSEPWEQTTGFWKRSLSNPYRMMNTSGTNFRDHAGSIVRLSFPKLYEAR
jgi:21S rRNA (uridine2791-2'-O)-methyltransferase